MKFDVKKIKNAKGEELKYRGMKTLMFQPINKNNKFKRATVEKEVEKFIKSLREQDIDGLFKVTLQYPGNRYYSGKFTDIQDEDPHIFDLDKYDHQEDPGLYTNFQIFVLSRPEEVQQLVEEPVEESDEEPVEVVKLKKKPKKLVGGCLSEGDKPYSNAPFKVRGISDVESKVIIVRKYNDKCDYYKNSKLYEERSFDKDLGYYYKTPRSSGYLIVVVSKDETRPLKEVYDEFVEIADQLKTETKGHVNMYKTGSIIKTSMYHFDAFVKKKYILPEIITPKEAEFISKSVCSALKYAKKGTYKNCIGYDVNSFYPSILKSSFSIPIKEGTFHHMDYTGAVGRRCEYGIYRAKITGNIDKRLFVINKNDYYTHIDMNRAIKLKYDVRFIQDGKPNYLKYTRDDLVQGNTLFGEYIKYFYDLKTKGVKGAKLILNCLWGWLVKKTYMNLSDYGSFDIGDDKEIENMHVDQDGKLHATCVKLFQMYATNYARFEPFLLAESRSRLSEFYSKQIDAVVQINVDGFIMTEPLEGVELKSQISYLKCEDKHTGKLQIENVNYVSKKCMTCKEYFRANLFSAHSCV